MLTSQYRATVRAEFKCHYCGNSITSIPADWFFNQPIEIPPSPDRMGYGWVAVLHPNDGVVWCCDKHTAELKITDKS